MSDYCLECNADLALTGCFSKYFNAWYCNECGYLNRNCDGKPSVPETFDRVVNPMRIVSDKEGNDFWLQIPVSRGQILELQDSIDAWNTFHNQTKKE
jgi:hypothetical protein